VRPVAEHTTKKLLSHVKRVAMTPDERNAFLGTARTCRIATISHDGPHATPVWFVWDGAALWIVSLCSSRRWRELQRDPRVAVTIDEGRAFEELHGVTMRGIVEIVGEVPRTDSPHPNSGASSRPSQTSIRAA
jgi:general stress protein 26